jgi:hypothetical protein
MNALTLGRTIGLAFAAFALVALVASVDMARGRTPQTQSPLILDVLAGGAEKQCRRDVSTVVARHIRIGMSASEARGVIDAAAIVLPEPWFWRPSLTQGLSETAGGIKALRTLRATVFGNELLRLDIAISEGKVSGVKAQVECAFN